MRKLSDSFIYDLKNPDGILHPILKQVKLDDTIILSIRNNYINVYYRGGNIIKVTESSKNSYQTFFDYNYNITEIDIPKIPRKITTQADSLKWVKAFPQLKAVMNGYIFHHNKPEREFQQLVSRENNFSSISNSSDYFVTDIEFADSELGARFDMLAVLWSSKQRQSTTACRVALIEMKYGDKQLTGKSGILKHLKDMSAVINSEKKYSKLVSIAEAQFNQLYDLGLIKVNKTKRVKSFMLNKEFKPEVIFLLANHNPKSTVLRTLMNKIDWGKYKNLDIKFFVSSFAGYGMHSDCMLSLPQFQKLLNR